MEEGHQNGELPQNCCAIIPAYDEAQRIGEIARIVVDSGLFSEIVVVDDGSTDSTAKSARAAGAKVISHEKNRGKPAAMLTGLNETSAQVVCFLDADLLNVTPEHLQSLTEPVLTGREMAALAVFRGGRLSTTLAQKIAPMISGQRCLKRELLAEFNSWESGFGIETALNSYLSRRGIEQKIVYWEGAGQVMKEEKRGFFPGLIARLKMFGEIIMAWFAAKFKR